MPQYLLLYTINKGNTETQEAANSRRDTFDEVCRDNKYRPLDGHQTAYKFNNDMTAVSLFNALLDQAKSKGRPLKEHDKLYIVEIDGNNEKNG